MQVETTADFIQYLENLARDKGVPDAQVKMQGNQIELINQAGQTHKFPISEIEAAIKSGNVNNVAMQILSEHLV